MHKFALLLVLLAAAGGAAIFASSDRAAGNPLTEVAAIGIGNAHSCAVMETGAAMCWGNNIDGQLGNGFFCDPCAWGLPSDVVNLDVGLTSISGGGSHTCAITIAGGVKCWGSNGGGQLGDGQACGQVCLAVDVCAEYDEAKGQCLTPLSDITAIAAGGSFTCAVKHGGDVVCWGFHQGSHHLTPADVAGLEIGVISISAGEVHVCAVLEDGSVRCWGSNITGQLGDLGACGTVCWSPVAVLDMPGAAVEVAAGGNHSCARMSDGGVVCWGDNRFGQLGTGKIGGRAAAVPVAGLNGAIAIGGGDAHTCAILSTGELVCWGENSHGQVGDGTMDPFGFNNRPSPTDVIGLQAEVSAVTGGDLHTCALLDSNQMQCWGQNFYGQLGDDGACGILSPCPRPVTVLLASKPTPTPTRTNTPTMTPTPAVPPGDVNCDGAVSSVDALLILQFDARLLASLPCEHAAHMNGDGVANSLDALLILQNIAGY